MTQATNELIYEILKQLQSGQTELRTMLSDQTRQLIRVREGAGVRAESAG